MKVIMRRLRLLLFGLSFLCVGYVVEADAETFPSYLTEYIENFTYNDLETQGDEYHPYTAGVVAMDAGVSVDELFGDMVDSFRGLTARVIAMHGEGESETKLAYLYCFPHRVWLVETDTVNGGIEIQELSVNVDFNDKNYVQKVIKSTYSQCEKYKVVDTELTWKYAVALYYQVTGEEQTTNENSETHRLANEYMEIMSFPDVELPTLVAKWPVEIDVAVDLPENVEVEEAIFWLNHATTFPAYVNEEDNQIVGSFEAWEPGLYIVRLEAYLSGAPVTKEITIDGTNIKTVQDVPNEQTTEYGQHYTGMTLSDVRSIVEGNKKNQGPIGIKKGEIRYVSQVKGGFFVEDYWNSEGRDLTDIANKRCDLATFSSVLSYLGVDCTPAHMAAITDCNTPNLPAVRKACGVQKKEDIVIRRRPLDDPEMSMGNSFWPLYKDYEESFIKQEYTVAPVAVYFHWHNEKEGNNHWVLVIGVDPNDKSKWYVTDAGYQTVHSITVDPDNMTFISADGVNRKKENKLSVEGAQILSFSQWKK